MKIIDRVVLWKSNTNKVSRDELMALLKNMHKSNVVKELRVIEGTEVLLYDVLVPIDTHAHYINPPFPVLKDLKIKYSTHNKGVEYGANFVVLTYCIHPHQLQIVLDQYPHWAIRNNR